MGATPRSLDRPVPRPLATTEDTVTATNAADIERIGRPEARVIAEEEFRRYAACCASFTDAEWALPTDCTGWTVRDLSLHVLGSADAQASVKEFLHQFVRGLPVNHQIDSHHWVDGLNELQIRER